MRVRKILPPENTSKSSLERARQMSRKTDDQPTVNSVEIKEESTQETFIPDETNSGNETPEQVVDEVVLTPVEYSNLAQAIEDWKNLTIGMYGALHVAYKAMSIAQSAKGKRERVKALSPAMGQAVELLLDAAPIIASSK
jgi:hypothetical protein